MVNRLISAPQRKDYTALTKFLPPKHEYVLSVRVTPIQCKLYRYYLEHFTGENVACLLGKNFSELFRCREQLSL